MTIRGRQRKAQGKLSSDATARERCVAMAMDLRVRGYSTREIAIALHASLYTECVECGFRSQQTPGMPSNMAVRKLLARGLKELRDDVALSAEDMRAEADHRIRTAQGQLLAIAGDDSVKPAVKVQALRGYLTGEDRRARLWGLDKKEQTGTLAELAGAMLSRIQEQRSFNSPSAAPPAALLAPDPQEHVAVREVMADDRGAIVDLEARPADRAVSRKRAKPLSEIVSSLTK